MIHAGPCTSPSLRSGAVARAGRHFSPPHRHWDRTLSCSNLNFHGMIPVAVWPGRVGWGFLLEIRMSDMNTDTAKRLLDGVNNAPWSESIHDGAPVDNTNRLLFWPSGSSVRSESGVVTLAVAAPDLARAYLAEHARAQQLLHELTALREYLELNAQESPDIDECFSNSEALHADDRRRIDQFLARRDAVRLGEVAAERNRLAARVAELEAAAAPVEWRTFQPDEPPLWMVKAHEKRGGWWQTRQVRRFRTYTDERGAYIDSKAGEVDEQQEWRPGDGNGNPLPWPVHGAEGVADAI